MRILIIKTSATGDVVRTSSVLHAFPKADICWITSPSCFTLFDGQSGSRLRLISIHDIPESVIQDSYDLVLSLEEDEFCAKLAYSLHTKKLTGVYSDGTIRYTEDAAGWFDMSLVSHYGRAHANRLKLTNRKSYQDFLFGMIGKEFKGQTYCIHQPRVKPSINCIGMEKNAGDRWPGKRWFGYDQLAQLLKASGFDIVFFERRDQLRQYMTDIASCGLVVSGDTLAMHLALAFARPVVSIFNCTSPAEIYDYGLLKKIVNPRLEDYFYSTSDDPALISMVPVDQVYRAVTETWNLHYSPFPQTKETDAT